MELYEVTFKGKKVTLKKDSEGNYSIDLPTKNLPQGELKESITHDERGWRYTSKIENQPDCYFNLWLNDEGEFFWNNAARENPEPLDLTSKSTGSMVAIARELSSTVEQIKLIQEKGIPATDILKKRMSNLVTVINLLGYQTFGEILGEVNDSPGFMALNRLAEQLNEQMDFENIARYIRPEGSNGKELIVRVSVPQDMTREEFDRMYKPLEQQFDSNLLYKKDQEKWIDEKRGYAFDYNALMSMKLMDSSPDGKNEEWKCYEKAVESMARLYVDLNFDLLIPEMRSEFNIPENRRLRTKIECADAISNVIDSASFNKACRVENEFAYAEAERMKKIVESKLEGTIPSEDESDRTKKARKIVEQEAAEMEKRKNAIDRAEKEYKKHFKGEKTIITDRDLDEKE